MSFLLIKIFVPGNTQVSIKVANVVVFPVACSDDTVKSFLNDNAFEPGLISKISFKLLLDEAETAADLPPAAPPDTNVTSSRASEPENVAREEVISLSDDVICNTDEEILSILEPRENANDDEALDNDCDAVNNDAVFADADKFALFAKPRANTSDSSLEDVKESLTKECDTANDADAFIDCVTSVFIGAIPASVIS